MFDLKNKVILITGGYGYLGSAMVDGLCEHNATVVVLGRSLEKFNLKFKNISNINFVEFDISSSSDEIENIFKSIKNKYGHIDVIINNAFYLEPFKSVDKVEDFSFGKGIEGVLNSVHKCIKCIIPIFKDQNFGKIINISSMYGVIAPDFKIYKGVENFTNPPQYGVAKAGVIQLTKYFASLLGENNILVNSICPGAFPSEEVQKQTKFIKSLEEKTVLKRIGKPQDLKGITVLLSSDESNYITGQNFIIDGGWTTI